MIYLLDVNVLVALFDLSIPVAALVSRSRSAVAIIQ